MIGNDKNDIQSYGPVIGNWQTQFVNFFMLAMFAG